MKELNLDTSDDNIKKQIETWLLSDEYNEKLRCELHELSLDEIEYQLYVWKDRIDSMRHVMSNALTEMAIQINNVMLKLPTERGVTIEAEDGLEEHRIADDLQRTRDINSTINSFKPIT